MPTPDLLVGSAVRTDLNNQHTSARRTLRLKIDGNLMAGYKTARLEPRRPGEIRRSDHHRLAHLTADGDELAAVHQRMGPGHGEQRGDGRGPLGVLAGFGLVEFRFGDAVEDGQGRGPLRLPQLLVPGPRVELRWVVECAGLLAVR